MRDGSSTRRTDRPRRRIALKRAVMSARLLVVTLIGALVTTLTACRDEQAGPRPRPTVPPPPGAPSGAGAAGSVRTLDAAPTPLTFRSGATWGDGAVRYLGARVEPPGAGPGSQVRVSHYFQAE